MHDGVEMNLQDLSSTLGDAAENARHSSGIAITTSRHGNVIAIA